MRQSGHVETDKEALNLVISPVKQQNLKYLKGLMNSQKDMISYKEYLQVRLFLFVFVYLCFFSSIINSLSLFRVILSVVFLSQASFTCSNYFLPSFFVFIHPILQFCQDFCLKSTALLTATQLGEIYLSIVPLHSVSSVQQSTHSARHNDASGKLSCICVFVVIVCYSLHLSLMLT